MSLTKFTGNTNVISELSDTPTETATELKAKFDEAGTSIKNYLNNTLTEETEQLVSTTRTNLQTLIANLRTELITLINTNNQNNYPVGKIILSTENINPYTYLGFGTWELWGQGKVPVGVDSEDSDFDESEKTGGEKTHTLTIQEMPSHSHRFNVNNTEGAGGYRETQARGNNSTGEPDWKNASTLNTGGGQAHNNLQPYITCYMWKRVS